MKTGKRPSIKDLLKLEIFTIKEAQVYVERHTGMKKSMFFDCVRPLLKAKPIAKNFRTLKPSHLVVKKSDVDQIIADMKSRIVE